MNDRFATAQNPDMVAKFAERQRKNGKRGADRGAQFALGAYPEPIQKKFEHTYANMYGARGKGGTNPVTATKTNLQHY